MNIKMIKLDERRILDYGFELCGKSLYRKMIPQTFRGQYWLYICHDDIYGIFQGITTQEHELPSFLRKMRFRTPEAAQACIDLIKQLKTDGVIDFEEE